MFNGNRVVDQLSGGLDTRCEKEHAPSGIAFLREGGDSTSIYQPEFIEGETRWSICVQPPR
jgi:hypothetical protein